MSASIGFMLKPTDLLPKSKAEKGSFLWRYLLPLLRPKNTGAPYVVVLYLLGLFLSISRETLPPKECETKFVTLGFSFNTLSASL